MPCFKRYASICNASEAQLVAQIVTHTRALINAISCATWVILKSLS